MLVVLTFYPHSFLSRLKKVFYTINFLTQNTNEGFVVSRMSRFLPFFHSHIFLTGWDLGRFFYYVTCVKDCFSNWLLLFLLSILIIFLLLYQKLESNNYRMIWKTLFTLVARACQENTSWFLALQKWWFLISNRGAFLENLRILGFKIGEFEIFFD